MFKEKKSLFYIENSQFFLQVCLTLTLVAFLAKLSLVFQFKLDIGFLDLFRLFVSNLFAALIWTIVISIVPFRILKYFLIFFIIYLFSGNWEHAEINDSNFSIHFLKFASDPTFLKGSILNKRSLTKLIVLLVFSLLSIFALRKIPLPKLHPVVRYFAPIPLFAILFFWPLELSKKQWLQISYIEDNIISLIGKSKDFKGTKVKINNFVLKPALTKSDLSGESLLNPNREAPQNILLLMVEGISKIHFKKGYLPKLTQLSKQGIHYPNFITNQRQTNRGMYSILCGDYPNLSVREAKADVVSYWAISRPCLPEHLQQLGYHSVFMQGANLNYMNKKDFTKKAGFQEAYGDPEYPANLTRYKWGVADSDLYNQMFEYLKSHKDQKTFLSSLTVSTHHPFSIPGKPQATHEEAIRYADQSVYDFIEKLRTEGILDNTLVFILSDEAAGESQILYSHNWSELTVLGKGITPKIHSQYFHQGEVANSVLDYTSADSPFGGRSLFREYTKPREYIFSNVFTNRVYYFNQHKKTSSLCTFEMVCEQFQNVPDDFLNQFHFEKSFAANNKNNTDVQNLVETIDFKYPGNKFKVLLNKKSEEVTIRKENNTEDFFLQSFKTEIKKGEKIIFQFKASLPGTQTTPLKVIFDIYDKSHEKSKKLHLYITPGENSLVEKTYVHKRDNAYVSLSAWPEGVREQKLLIEQLVVIKESVK